MNPAPGQPAATQPVTWRVGLVSLLVSFLWSGNIVSIKFGLATIPPFWSAFWRMLAGTAAVAGWARLTGAPVLPEPGSGRQLLGLAAMFTAQIAVFNLAVEFTSPAYAVIILNICPVLVNLISHFFVPDDRLTLRRLAGLAAAFGGISYVMLGRPSAALAPRPLLGNCLMLFSAALLATRIVYTQHLVRRADPLRPVIWQMALSLPAFLALGLAFERPLLQPLSYEPVLAILYQAVVVAGFCFVTWTKLLQRHSAGNLAMYSFSVPFFGILLAALLFGERVTPRLVEGALAVSAGIAIVVRSKSKKAADGA